MKYARGSWIHWDIFKCRQLNCLFKQIKVCLETSLFCTLYELSKGVPELTHLWRIWYFALGAGRFLVNYCVQVFLTVKCCKQCSQLHNGYVNSAAKAYQKMKQYKRYQVQKERTTDSSQHFVSYVSAVSFLISLSYGNNVSFKLHGDSFVIFMQHF